MDKKELILSAAMKLFGIKGFEGTSVRDIAAEAGVNPAMISYYFGSKEKLLESLVEYKAAYMKGVFAELVDNKSLKPIEKLDIVIDRYINRIFEGPQFHHLLSRELSLERRYQMKDAIAEILLRNISSAKRIIQQGIDSGEFREVDTELTMTSILGTITYLLSSEIMCRKMLQKGKEFNPYQSKKLRERLSDHLKKMIRAHLELKDN